MSSQPSLAHLASIIPIPFLTGSEWQPHFSSDEKPGRTPAADGAKLRIIVVDDEVLIAETLAEILNAEGFDARAVTAGDAALTLAQTFVPDIVFSDVIMPGMTGVDLGIKIRSLVPLCKIFLFSGQAATVDLLDKARKQGHRFEILAKPIRPEMVVELVRRAAGRA
jgi:DNA-binding NtrC family response regulator